MERSVHRFHGMKTSTFLHTLGVSSLLWMCTALAGCTTSDPRDGVDAYVGDFADESYAGERGSVIGRTAESTPVSLEQFAGHFVWVDYAAPWCPPCAPQARAIADLERLLGERVVFLTVVTSGAEVMTRPSAAGAGSWAQKYGLPREHVVAGARHTGMVVPQHLLFSPTGQTLYRHKGLLYSDQISGTIVDHMTRWKKENLTYGLGWD